jgi:hypothetical protein
MPPDRQRSRFDKQNIPPALLQQLPKPCKSNDGR